MNLGHLFVLVCATALTVACTARNPAPSATDTTSSAVLEDVQPPGTETETAMAEDPLICKSVAQTGTRVARRTCMRRSTQEQQQRDAREALDAVQRRGVQTGNPTRD